MLAWVAPRKLSDKCEPRGAHQTLVAPDRVRAAAFHAEAPGHHSSAGMDSLTPDSRGPKVAAWAAETISATGIRLLSKQTTEWLLALFPEAANTSKACIAARLRTTQG